MRCNIFLLLTLFMLASCGVAPNTSRQSLNGGEASLTGLHSVVRIAAGDVSYCSGVLVADDLVVTAAHCLNAEAGSALPLTVVFPLAQGPKSRIIAEYKALRDDSLLFFPNFDIAWIRLKEAAPAPYAPAEILGNTKDVPLGHPLNLVGMAHATPCHPSDVDCALVQLETTLKSSWSSPHLVNLAVVDSSGANASSGTCPGDSGGPAFIEKDGLTLLYGIVAGKDSVFTSRVTNACGSPTSVLTRIGEYQEWLETTSNRKIKVYQPSPATLSLAFLTGRSNPDVSYNSWQDWFSKPMASDSSWVTVHKILEQIVLEFQPEIKAEDIPTVFQTGGQEWAEKITELRSLSLGFPYQSIAIEDLRPLAALKNLRDLTFLARRYKGVPVLATLANLKTLNIIGRVITRPEQGIFAWRDLASPSLETLRLSQLTVLQMKEIDWNHFPHLTSLTITTPTSGKIPSSWVREERLGSLVSLHIQELSCDTAQWPKQAMPNLKSLMIRSTFSPAEKELSCINWELLPNLTHLSIQGYQIDLPTFSARMPPALAALLNGSQ